MDLKGELLAEVKQKGFMWTTPDISDEIFDSLEDLVKEGKLTTIDKEGIKLMNESWCYIVPGNPSRVHVVSKDGSSWLQKSVGRKKK